MIWYAPADIMVNGTEQYASYNGHDNTYLFHVGIFRHFIVSFLTDFRHVVRFGMTLYFQEPGATTVLL